MAVDLPLVWKPQWSSFSVSEQARLKTRQGVRTIGFTEVDVLDLLSGRRVKRDGVTMGEILMRGSSVMLGYLKDPVGTRKCLKDEWIFTDDIGVIYEDGVRTRKILGKDGYLAIKDRLKDVIISGGENVSSVEVETVLYTNTVVNEVAVVARPADYWGETPCAFVCLKQGLNRKPKEDELIEKMPYNIVPKTVLFVDELPKSSTGKVCKFVLKEIASKMGSTKLTRINMSVLESITKGNKEEKEFMFC